MKFTHFSKWSTILTKELRLKIRKYDNFICQNCHMTGEEHLNILSKTFRSASY